MPGRASLRGLWLYAAFWLSGVSAVLYQLVWQRVLLGIYGVQIEAVTVVVTAFLLGLGMGSLGGGWLTWRWPGALLRIFGWLEVGTSLYGSLSVTLFRRVGVATAGADPAATWLVLMALLALPTAFMGATLPVLVAVADSRTRNVGAAVGGLYAVNTLGSAVGALAAVLIIIGSLGQQGTAWCAAAINLLVGLSAIGVARAERTAR